jgi:hypothetical protein
MHHHPYNWKKIRFVGIKSIYSSADPDNFKREGGSTQIGGPE